MSAYDAVVVGSGPNGFAAAITVAKAGYSVLLLEKERSLGGGMRTEALTEPGFYHDVCSAVHPLAQTSPFFSTLDLHKHGVEWIHSPASLAHPFDDGSAALLYQSIEETASFFESDRRRYEELFTETTQLWKKLKDFLLSPALQIPQHPIDALRFGLKAIQSCKGFCERQFLEGKTQAFVGGIGAHAIVPLTYNMSASFALVLGALGHIDGWPIPKGGSHTITAALEKIFVSLGGEIKTSVNVSNFNDLPKAKAYLFDVSPLSLLSIAKDKLSSSYRNRLARYRYGPGVCKVDWALKAPIPWKNRDCSKAITLHLGGTFEEICYSESKLWSNEPSNKPYVLLSQPSLFDAMRAPAGFHTAWGYCHTPYGASIDMTKQIEDQVERFAPGFKDVVISRRTFTAKDFENHNPNIVGGDIACGANIMSQILARPILSFCPYQTSDPHIYLCSAATPPGAGVHGMCGYHAARAALKKSLEFAGDV